MLLAIFRDIFSKNRLYLFLFSLSILLYYKYVRVEFSTNFRILMLSTFIVTALSTFQLLYSYFLTDRMEGYFQLPISINYFKITFIFVTFILNFFERILFLILFLNVTIGYFQFIKLILFSLLVILSVFYVFIKLNTKLNVLSLLLIIGMVGIDGSILLLNNIFYMLVGSIIVGYLILRNKELIYIVKNESSPVFNKRRHNYFMISLMQEKYFFINSIFTLLFILLIIFQDYPEQLKTITLLTIVSVNTPLTTLFSADKDLIVHVKSLPQSTLFFLMYFRVLLSYYLITNLLVSFTLKLFVLKSLRIDFLLLAIGLAIIEAIMYLMIEIYFPLQNWNLKRELWKHPRKYIVPAIIFFYWLDNNVLNGLRNTSDPYILLLNNTGLFLHFSRSEGTQ